MSRIALLLVLIFGMSQCANPERSATFQLPNIPKGFPIADSIRNMGEHEKRQAELGKALFFDKRLSRKDDVSCGSCHRPAQAFADVLTFSVGSNAGLGVRNTPSLFNLSFHELFFWDGGIPRLSEVALAPMDNMHELDLPIRELALKLRGIQSYKDWFADIYQREPDPFSITRALMWFQLSLVSANSRYDRYIYEQQADALTDLEKEGEALFFSEVTQCVACHAGPNFSDGQFYNIGLDMRATPDTGRARISLSWDDFGKFKTPSMRNLGFTAPYMHDGRFKNLEEALAYFNRGGDGSDGQDPRIRPLGLNEQQLESLKAFLLSLNDTIFINHSDYQPTSLVGYRD